MANDESPMSTPQAPEPQAPAVADDAIGLLTVDVCHTGWEHSIAQKKSFYVRGATWFYNNVMRPISDIQKRPAEDFDSIFKRLPEFRKLSLDWDEAFSPRQAMSALSLRNRQAIRFHKAVQTILLCDQIVRERVDSRQIDVPVDEALRRMRIEPAVFYIQDFDSEELAKLKSQEPQILERLRAETDQRTRAVFGDLAAGKTVTRQLAEMTRAALVKILPDTEFGAVDCGHRPGVKGAATPAEVLPD